MILTVVPTMTGSGGGAGHEPAHAGYVGSGMLTAAVCGDVFASPSAAAVLAAIQQVPLPGAAQETQQQCCAVSRAVWVSDTLYP